MKVRILAGILLYSATALGNGAAAFDLFGEGVETRVTSGQGSPDIQTVQQEAYDGPKVRVAVSRFANKTRKHWWSREIGDGMADQLTTALFNSGRFIVLERQTLGDVMAEQDLARSGRIRSGTGAATGKIEGAELLVTGAVTEFEADAGGTGGGFGGGVGRVLGAIVAATKKAHMAIDIRVVDARTSRIVAATSVEGTATDVDVGAALGGYWGGGALGGALRSWKNTPKEKALRMCIQRAVDFIVSKTPSRYYHHGSGPAYSSETPRSSTRSAMRAPAPARSVPNYTAGSLVRVTGSRLNVRGGPGSVNPVLFSVTGGTRLRVGGQSGNWLQVETGDGRSGWVAGWLVQKESASSASDFRTAAPVPAPAPVSSAAVPARPLTAPAAASSPPVQDVSSRLKGIKKLYDQGLITDQEYKAKRKAILDAL